MKLIKWFGAIFEDQAGSPSSKRFVLFICLFFYYLLLKGSLEGKPVNEEILFTTGGLILFCVGAVTSEFLMKMYQDKSDKNKPDKPPIP
jgi:hypothetical protein